MIGSACYLRLVSWYNEGSSTNVILCRICSSVSSAFAKTKGVILSVDPFKLLRITGLSLQLNKVCLKSNEGACMEVWNQQGVSQVLIKSPITDPCALSCASHLSGWFGKSTILLNL